MMTSQESSQESQEDVPSEGSNVEPIPLWESQEVSQPNREDHDALIRVLDKTNTCLKVAAYELESLSESALEGADLDGATFSELQEDMHNLRDKAAKRAVLIKRLKKRVMNEETTTAVESSLDTQPKTEANRQTQMIENCKTYLTRDAGPDRAEQESRGELMSREKAKNMWSDSGTDGVEEVKTP